MDYLDSKFDAWLDEHEAEADRVKRLADYRQRQAGELLLYINHARVLVSRAKDGVTVDSSEIEALLGKIKDLRTKISK